MALHGQSGARLLLALALATLASCQVDETRSSRAALVDTQSQVVRFIALGDGGEGNATQYAVAAGAVEVCAQRGCDFALYLGDNFYDNGVESVDDDEFTTKFEQPYQDLNIPFYVIMGNHDYGDLGFEWYKSGYQIGYSNDSSKWNMPNEWYDVRVRHVHLFGFDSQHLLWDHNVSDQRVWLRNRLASSDATWKFAFAHHPYISNGSHGNAGRYEGVSWPDFISGEEIEEFIEDEVCGKADVYFSGHDHNRQWLGPVCGTHFIVSGVAAKIKGFKHRQNNPTLWEDDTKAGFFYAEVRDNTFYGAFYDQNGVLDFEYTFQK
ncbi:MAG: metallophosphoesterase [Proteobacteria bacterium]|nr:metallophosphoesterase [Pseudomonadota bacterium]